MSDEIVDQILNDLIEMKVLEKRKKKDNSLTCKNCNTQMIGVRRQKGTTFVCHTCSNNFFEEMRKPD